MKRDFEVIKEAVNFPPAPKHDSTAIFYGALAILGVTDLAAETVNLITEGTSNTETNILIPVVALATYRFGRAAVRYSISQNRPPEK
jgi:hypothetical protein